MPCRLRRAAGGVCYAFKEEGGLMAYNTINNLNNVYNFYMTTYAPKSSTPYDTHKKSELRHVYNSIVKMNKEAPLFILDTNRTPSSLP